MTGKCIEACSKSRYSEVFEEPVVWSDDSNEVGFMVAQFEAITQSRKFVIF